MIRIPATPAARKKALELGIDLARITGTGEYGSVSLRDIPVDASEGQKSLSGKTLKITPAAEGMAAYYGIDTSDIASRGSRLKKSDVQLYVDGMQAADASSSADSAIGVGLASGFFEESAEIIPLKGMRKIITENMLNSMHTQPQYTMCAELDTTVLFNFLSQAKEGFSKFGGGRLTFTDVMVKIVALALMEHPLLNASLREDKIYRFKDVHMGVAVALDDGLIVPVIRDAEKLSLGMISRTASDLVGRAREGKLSPAEYRGATFSISNLGNFPVDFSTPIINTPEGGILGISRTSKKAVVVNDEIVIRTMTGFSLTLDHRIIDGIEGAKFLKTLEEMLLNPWVVLVEKTEN
ncbi:MAG: 2-oxo acid dehydrogenase subunit E2 [Spirochaetales bacterium]|nr:2-oxo acid dehydrogenase subunit E2 [Spirochaetales bacterium]